MPHGVVYPFEIVQVDKHKRGARTFRKRVADKLGNGLLIVKPGHGVPSRSFKGCCQLLVLYFLLQKYLGYIRSEQ